MTLIITFETYQAPYYYKGQFAACHYTNNVCNLDYKETTMLHWGQNSHPPVIACINIFYIG